MKKYYLLSALLMLAACDNKTEEYFEPISPESKQEGVVMTIPQYVFENGDKTRTVITPTSEGMSFAWKEGDQVGVYATSSMANFDIMSINEDATSATFDGGGFSLTAGSTYYALYPYNASATSKTEVPVSYLGQAQVENGSYSHLPKYDYMVASATATATNAASFNFAHLGAIMRFKITVPEPGVYTNLTVKSADSDFVKEGTVDLSASTPTIVPEVLTDNLILTLGEDSQGITLAEDNLELTAYILTAPVDLSGKTLTVSVVNDSDEEFSNSVKGKNLVAGGAYAFNNILVEEEDTTPYVTFHSDGAQTLKMTKAVPTLQYSVDGGTWADLGTTEVSFGGTTGDLRLRGKSLTGTATNYFDNSNIIFSNEIVTVAASGDIRTLVDYSKYETVDCSNARFSSLFSGCKQLTTAPKLPATTLADYCYESMFMGCVNLITAPELPATTLATSCYANMFYTCMSLATAPELPATTLADYCYQTMFSECPSLTTAPELPATVLTKGCYGAMFQDCINLETAPTLPATTLAYSCYSGMFAGCTSLKTAPMLPAKTLADFCYSNMFINCTSLTSAPELPATTLTFACYVRMFANCISLTEAPSLSATTLADECCSTMFAGCTSLKTAPVLQATILSTSCYANMFNGCSNLSSIKMLATDINATECLDYWTLGVANNGTFYKSIDATWNDDVVVPEGWTVKYLDAQGNEVTPVDNTPYLTLSAAVPQELTMSKEVPTLQCSIGNGEWEDLGTETKTFGGIHGDLRLRGQSLEGTNGAKMKFAIGSVNVVCFGDIRTIIDYSKYETVSTSSAKFNDLFNGCSQLTAAPSLPATDLAEGCYKNMFKGCSLRTPPSLPATTLSNSCYESMFYNCSQLITAPKLPAEELKKNCYYAMFYGCTSLATAPKLPAENLAQECYNAMFMGCTALDTAPELPATTLAVACYSSMFYGCTSLTTAPALPATTLPTWCYSFMFYGCTSLVKAPDLLAPTLTTNCYGNMFQGCRKLVEIKMLATDTSASSCLGNWVFNVASTGTFIKHPNATLPTGTDGIPSGWTVQTATN